MSRVQTVPQLSYPNIYSLSPPPPIAHLLTPLLLYISPFHFFPFLPPLQSFSWKAFPQNAEGWREISSGCNTVWALNRQAGRGRKEGGRRRKTRKRRGKGRKKRKGERGGGTDAGGQIACWLTSAERDRKWRRSVCWAVNMCKCTSVEKKERARIMQDWKALHGSLWITDVWQLMSQPVDVKD